MPRRNCKLRRLGDDDDDIYMGLKLILVGGPKLWRQEKSIDGHGEPTTTLNVPISEGGANSSHKHILAKFQSY